MLLAMIAVCVVLGHAVHEARDRQHFINLCEGRGWRVYYDYEYSETGSPHVEFDRATNRFVEPTPYGPDVLRKVLGHAYFCKIQGIGVRLNDDADHQLFAQWDSQSSITFLQIDGTFGKNDLEAMATFPRLAKLSIKLAVLTPDEIRSIDEDQPECDVYIRNMQPPAIR